MFKFKLMLIATAVHLSGCATSSAFPKPTAEQLAACDNVPNAQAVLISNALYLRCSDKAIRRVKDVVLTGVK